MTPTSKFGGVPVGPVSKFGGVPVSAAPPAVAEPEQQPDNRGMFERFASSLMDSLSGMNPVAAIKEYIDRPKQLGDAVHAAAVLNKVRTEKRQPTADEQEAIDRGMAAHLSMPGSGSVSDPALQATKQATEGNLAGAAGTLVGSYGVPVAVGAVVKGGPGAARSAVTKIPERMTTGVAQEVAGVISPRLSHAMDLINRLRSSISEAKATEAPPVEAAPTAAQPEAAAGVQIPAAPPAASPRVPLRPPVSNAAVAPVIEQPRTLAEVASAPPPQWNPEALGPDPFKQTDAYRQGVEAMQARRRGAAPAPAPSKEVIQSPSPVVADQGGTAPAAFMDSEATGTQIPQVANARAAVADKMAQHFYDYGITSEQIAALEANKPVWRSFWDQAGQIPGASKQKGYRPSAETIDAVRDRLATLEQAKAKPNPPVEAPAPAAGPLAGNPKARKYAEALARELSQ